MGKAAPETRWKVYRALRNGESLTGACSLLGIARSTVEHHVRALVKAGAVVRREARPGRPATFGPGPRFELWEAQNKPHGGRAGTQAAEPMGTQVHRGGFRVKVAPFGARDALPDDAATWTTNATDHAEWEHTTASGRVVRVRQSKGAHNCSLTLQPRPETVHGPEEVEAVERLWARVVAQAMDELSALYGYVRAGPVEHRTPMDYAWPAPFLEKGLRVQGADGEVTTDGTPFMEGTLETQSPRIAGAVAGLPSFMDQAVAAHRDLAGRVAIVGEAARDARDRAHAAVKAAKREAERITGQDVLRDEDMADLAETVALLVRRLDYRDGPRPEPALADFSPSPDVT